MSREFKTYKTLYCDFGFIQKVHTASNCVFEELFSFLINLNKHIDVVFNIPKSKRNISKSDFPLDGIEKKHTINSLILSLLHISNYKFIDDEKFSFKRFIKEHNYNVILFCDKNNTELNTLLSYGIIAINSSMLTIDFLNNLTTEKGKYIEKGENKTISWGEILPKNVNQCNSLIIIDQYIIQNKDDLKHNINAILETIIPQNLNSEFHIAIFCNFNPNNKGYNVEERFNEILKHLNDKNVPNTKNISITIYDSKNFFHDRYIITNNHFIESGAGFVILKNNQEPQNSTIIRSCYPFFISNSNNFQCTAYRHILSELAKIKQNNTNFPIKEKMHYEFFGNEMEKAPHRLIDQISKTQ